MGRNNAQTLNSIRMLCRMQQVEEKVLYEPSKLILSIYRDIWRGQQLDGQTRYMRS